MEDVHFTQVGRAIDVDESRDVFVREVSEERNLAQDAFRERDLLQGTGDHLDRDGLSRDLVRGRARCNNTAMRYPSTHTNNSEKPSTNMTNPYAPEPSSRMSFHLFST